MGEDNERHRPVMLHRVLVGSMERFIGGLVEHYAGAFPLWLSPEQVRVLPISEHFQDSASDFVGQLKAAGVRRRPGRPGNALLPDPRRGNA